MAKSNGVQAASIKVFEALVTQVPGAQHQFSVEKPIPAEAFLTNPAVAKVLFSYEPGCAVNYQAIKEKIGLLKPHLKVTQSGPALMKFFNELQNQRNMWAVAFAKWESHTIMTFMLEQKLYGRGLTLIEREALNANRPELTVDVSLKAAEKKLADTKTSREFARYVRILEECSKKHKIHLQRKAHAEKMRRDLARKKQTQAKARKAKKAALASSAMTQQIDPVQSTFNPDLPDFAQFMNSYVTPDTPAAAANVNEDVQPVGHNALEASQVFDSTSCGAKKPKRQQKNVSTTLPECSDRMLEPIGPYDQLVGGFASEAVTTFSEGAASSSELDAADLEMEKALRTELGLPLNGYLLQTDNTSPAPSMFNHDPAYETHDPITGFPTQPPDTYEPQFNMPDPISEADEAWFEEIFGTK